MIPRNLIQGWFGPGAMPDNQKVWCQQMKEMNPGWRYQLYGNEMLEHYGQDPYVKHLLAQQKPWAFVADRIRVLLLNEFGGVWLDTDSQPIKPLNHIAIWDMPNVTFSYGMRSPDRAGVALSRAIAFVDNSYLASAASSRMIKRLMEAWTPKEICVNGHRTGFQIMRYTDADCACLNFRYFYDMQPGPDAIVSHDSHNAGSWIMENTKQPVMCMGESVKL